MLTVERFLPEENTVFSYYCGSFRVGGTIGPVFVHPFLPAVVYADQFRLNLRDLNTSELSVCDINAWSNFHIACVHEFGLLAKIDDNTTSTIVHFSFI